MDNLETGPNEGGLSVNQAGEAFSSLLDRQPEDTGAAAEQIQEAATEQRAEPDAEQAAGEEREPGGDAEQTEKPAPEMFTVKIDGKEIQVPRDEVIAGYQRQQDATRKTMEAANLRKEAGAEIEQARAERFQYAENLQRFRHQLEGVLQDQQQIDWARLAEENPHEFIKQKHLYDQRQAALQQVDAQQAQLRSQAEAEQRTQFTEHLRNQREQVIAKIPEWKDEGKRKADVSAIQEYLTSHGYSADEIANVSDARAIVNVRKAMMYDRMIAQAAEATKRVAQTPTKVERPGAADTRNLDKRSVAYDRLKKSGRVEDAGSVFASLLS